MKRVRQYEDDTEIEYINKSRKYDTGDVISKFILQEVSIIFSSYFSIECLLTNTTISKPSNTFTVIKSRTVQHWSPNLYLIKLKLFS